MPEIRERAKVAAMEFAIRKLAPKFDGAWSLYLDRGRQRARQAEDEFVTSDGRTIPVFSDYRYGVKRALYRHLLVLETLKARGVLSDSEVARLKAITGTRTLTEPPESQIEFARTVAARRPDLFMPGWETDAEGPILRQREEDLRRIVGKFEAQHRKMFKLFAAADVLHLKPSASVLEIGYTTGGHSIFAFERLGLTAYGVDNFYEGITSDASQWKSSAALLGSKADFRFGDITTQTSYEPNKHGCDATKRRWVLSRKRFGMPIVRILLSILCESNSPALGAIDGLSLGKTSSLLRDCLRSFVTTSCGRP